MHGRARLCTAMDVHVYGHDRHERKVMHGRARSCMVMYGHARVHDAGVFGGHDRA